ncbi:MAG: DoxX family protein [Crocinitomicaceae bacterium]
MLVLEDQNRLQPWVFLNSLILLCSVIYSDQKERYAITTILLILSASYFWGGLQKANFFFGTEMFPWLAEFTGQQAFLREHPIVGVLVAGIEALAGLGLMFGFSRKIAAIILLLMHVFILTALGPFGHNWNHVVWPWNICFALLLFVLSNKKDIKLWERTLFRKKYYIFFFVAVAALPSLGVLGKWDHFLSGGYYSAVIPEAIFYYHEKDRSNLPESSTDFQYFTKGTREEFVLIDQWALNHLGVPSYPEIRVKKQIGKKLCSCLDYPKKAGLRIHYKYRFTQGRFETLEFPCSSLGFITGGLE